VNVAWHTILISAFIVSMTIYVIAERNDTAGWVYVLILLLGITLVFPGFREGLALFNAKNVDRPQQSPGGGPF